MAALFNGMMSINMQLLPLKGHFTLFNSAMGSVMPYIPTYARQLGYTPAVIGTIFFILPILGLIAKPLCGYLADRFKIHKHFLMGSLLLILVSFLALFSIPMEHSERKIPVEIECQDRLPIITACYSSENSIDQCRVNQVGHLKNSIDCQMNCNLDNSSMWQHHCHGEPVRSMCLTHRKSLNFTPNISRIINRADCIDIMPVKISSEDSTSPHLISCTPGSYNDHCSVDCNDPTLSSLIKKNVVSITCSDDNYMSITICRTDALLLETPVIKEPLEICQIKCTSKLLKTLTECAALVIKEEGLCRSDRSDLEFTASISPYNVIVVSNCISLDLEHINVDGGKTILRCPKSVQPVTKKYQPQCTIKCNNTDVNNLLGQASENIKQTEFNTKFWSLCLLLALSWVGQAVVVTFSDAICFDVLGPRASLYGRQRLWGSMGWGVFSLLTGLLIDYMSEGELKDYTIAFIFMSIFLICDMLVTYYMKVQSPHVSYNILTDIGSMLSSCRNVLFMMWIVAVGINTAILWQYLFFLVEDVAKLNCEEDENVKTIQGLVNAIQMFGGEIPAMFVSGFMLKKIGHHYMMSLILFAFSLRYILYSFLYNAWWFLLIELLHGMTMGMIYPTMASFANVVAPHGTETTVQGLVGAIFEGVGVSVGSFIGGQFYEVWGGWLTFRYFGYFALSAGLLHTILIWLLKKRFLAEVPPETVSVVSFIRTPEDMHHIFGENIDIR